MEGYKNKNKKDICYPNLPSAVRPVAQRPDIPIAALLGTFNTSPPDSEYECQ
jgi:hypothetical protein